MSRRWRNACCCRRRSRPDATRWVGVPAARHRADPGRAHRRAAPDAAETWARPPQLETIIATLPNDTALAARITWATMTQARRADPLFDALVATGVTPEPYAEPAPPPDALVPLSVVAASG